MVIFPAGIPYSLQKPKNPYRRDFSSEWQHWAVLPSKLLEIYTYDAIIQF